MAVRIGLRARVFLTFIRKIWLQIVNLFHQLMILTLPLILQGLDMLLYL